MMEDGGGESVVAIVQGMRDSGLAVTLMKRGLLQNSIRRSKKITVNKTSVDASTECKTQKCNTSAQICDGHYASSYQLAHCGYTPSAPPVTHSEYPLQRMRPTRSKGNFEVQRFTIGETNNRSTSSPSFRRPLTQVRGSRFYDPPSPKANISFVDSLRKYSMPLKAPGRSVSSELVQRLLDYTQAKHMSKNNSSSLRSIQNQSSRPSRNGRDKKTPRNSKIIQTYIKAFNKVLSQTEETAKKQKKSTRDSNSNLRGTAKEKNKSRRSFNTDTRCRSEHLDETYNYLKCSRKRPRYSGFAPDVRYLDGVRKCIRQTIKQVFASSTSECPTIRSRYSLHKREHHRRSVGTTHSDLECQDGQDSTTMKRTVSVICDTSSLCPNHRNSLCQYKEDNNCPAILPEDLVPYLKMCPAVQKYLSNLCKDVNVLDENESEEENICPALRSRLSQHKMAEHPSDQMDSDDDGPPTEIQAATSYSCRGIPVLPRCHPPPGTSRMFNRNCACKVTVGFDTTETEEQENETENRINFTTEAEKQILEWLEEIQFPADEKKEIKDKRREMVKQLVNKLTDLLVEDDFEDKLKEEIRKFVDSLPIQFPEDVEDEIQNGYAKDLFVTLFEVDYDAPDLDFNDIISQWLDEINLDIKNEEGKRICKKKLVKLFSNHLKPILNECNTTEELKQGILRILPMPTTANMQNEIFEVADKLVNLLNPILKRRDDIKNIFLNKKNVLSVQPDSNILSRLISDPSLNKIQGNQKLRSFSFGLENETNRPEIVREKNKKLANKFDQKLKDFQTKNIDNIFLESEINGSLKSLLENEIPVSFAQKRLMTGKQLYETKSQTKKDKNITNQNVQPGWIENVSNISEAEEKNTKLAKKFDQKLKDSQPNNKNAQKVMSDSLKSLPKKEKPHSITQKRKLADNMLNEVKSRPKRDKSEADQKSQPATDWVENVSHLDKKKDLPPKNGNNDVEETDINDFLKSLPEKKTLLSQTQRRSLDGKTLTEIKSKTKKDKSLIDQYTQPVTDRLKNKSNVPSKPTQRQQKDKDVQNEEDHIIIAEDVSSFVEDMPSLSATKQREIIKRIAELLTSNSQNPTDVKHQIVDILQTEAKMPARKVSDIANRLINKMKSIPLLSPNIQPLTNINTNSRVVKEALPGENLLVILKSITDTLNDNVGGTNDDNTKKRVLEILQNANVSKADAIVIVDKLMKRNAEIFTGNKYRDSVSGLDKSLHAEGSGSGRSMEKQTLEKNLSNADLDIIANKTGDYSPETRQKRNKDVVQLTEKLSTTTSNPMNIEDSIMSEISKHLKQLSSESREPREELKRLRSIQNSVFQASTPKKKDTNFSPERSSVSSENHYSENYTKKPKNTPISNPHDSTSEDDNNYDTNKLLFYPHKNQSRSNGNNFNPNNSRLQSADLNGTKYDSELIHESITKTAEENYVQELKKIVKSWMDETLPNSNASYHNGFKETMVSDLAGDIVDRQKYLQLSPNISTSPKEELEHLKYQVYRWLNKLGDVENFSSIMSKTPILMEKLKNVPVPQLASGERFKEQKIQTKLSKVINTWIDGINSSVVSQTDKNKLKQKIPEFVKIIQQMKLSNEIDNLRNILDTIVPLIRSVNKYIEERDLLEMAERLSRLLNKTDSSQILTQDTNEFIEENIAGALQDWLKKQPLYQKRNSNDKRMQEKIVNDLAKGLMTVFEQAATLGRDIDKYLIEEINKHVQQFPMDPKLNSNEKKQFIGELPLVILNYLKGLKLFQNISQRCDSQDDAIKNVIDRLIDNLPLHDMNSSGKIDLDNSKEQFTSRVIQIQKESEFINTSILIEEISTSLKKILVRLENGHENQGEKILNELGDQSINKHIQVSGNISLPAGSIEFINNAVAQWAKTLVLPKPDDSTIFEHILSKAQNDLISILANIFVYTDKVPLKNIKDIFEELTSQFLQKLPVNPYTTEEIEILADSLLDTFKECSRINPGTPTAKRKTADVLLDEIAKWVQNLPIEADTSEEKEQAEKIKQYTKCKLIHKIGELNLNPEVLNNDFLYEDMLQDEVDELLTNIGSENVNKNLLTLRNNLMDKVKESRQKIRDENAGQIYKQQLREAISKTLPFRDLSGDEQASFEVLKNDVADAFINLHYVGYNEEQMHKLQNKINIEINKFCNDYLKRHPATPIDSKMLNEDLYNALKNVSEPNNESYKDEVELLKIKDVLNDWVKELPLKKPTGQVNLQTNKMVSVLAIKLHHIEIEKQRIPDANEKMKNEIIKFMKNLPLLIKKDESIDLYAEKLLKDLINTEKLRMENITRHSIELDLDSHDCVHSIPPCMLSMADRSHLEKIREKIPRARLRFIPKPAPSDSEKRTLIKRSCIGTCCDLDRAQVIQIPSQRIETARSQGNVSPRVVIKDYYWDSVNETQTHPAPCSTSSLQQTLSQNAPKSCLVIPRPSINSPQCSRHQTRSCGSQYQIPCVPKTCSSTQYQLPDPTIPSRPELNLHQSQRTPGNFILPHQNSTVTQCPMAEQKDTAQQSRLFSEPSQLSCPGLRQNSSTNQSPCPSAHFSQRPYQLPTTSQGSAFQAGPCGVQRRTSSSSPRQPCFTRRDNLSEENELEPKCSFQNPRVTQLGSFDDDLEPNVCNRHHHWNKPPVRNEEYCWEARGYERKYREPMRYRSRQPMLRCTKKSYTMQQMKSCSKCCGVHCPHPSFMYFRR